MSEWIGGVRPVQEVLRAARRQLHEVWIEEGPAHAGLDVVTGLAAAADVPVRRVDRTTFAGVGAEAARRVAVRCGPYPYRDEELPEARPGQPPCLAVILDHLQDPQNVGAVLRTAEVAGCRAVILPTRRAAGVTPAVVRASAGASEHLAVYRETNLARALARLQERGWWTVALDAGGERWDGIDYRGAIALVVGSEGKGVQRLLRERSDFRAALPVAGQVASLNASAAFAAVAFEVVRQQTAAG